MNTAKRAAPSTTNGKRVKKALSPREQYNQQREFEKKEREEFQENLSKLVEGDCITSLFSERTLFAWVSENLRFDDCAALQAVSKTWYLIFNHRDFALWAKIGEAAMNGRYGYMNIRSRTLLKPSNLVYLNQWGLSLCHHCLMYAGRTNKTVSVFEWRDNSYFCINPSCGHELTGSIGSMEQRALFDTCVETSRRQPKSHTWKELKLDMRTPEGVAIDVAYEVCERCGVLRQESGLYNEDDYCPHCNHSKTNCPKYAKKYRFWLKNRRHKNAPKGSEELKRYKRYLPYRKIFTCQKCSYCGEMPDTCVCVKCLECTMCQGCARCSDASKLCQCVFCEGCGILVEYNKRYRPKIKRCECEDEF